MYHISIIGCCVLRDIFNSKFVQGYSDNFKVDTYINGSAMPSIMSKPITFDIGKLEKFNDYYFEYHYFELTKSQLATLEIVQSDVIIMDFYYDAHYGMYEYGDTYIRGRLKNIKKSGAIDNNLFGKYYNFENNPKEYYKIWCKSFDRFMEYAKEHFPNTKILINGIKGSNQITDENGFFIDIQNPDLDIDKLNAFWSKLDEYCEKKYNIPVIRYDKDYTIDKNYRFGLGVAAVHFHRDYYQDAHDKILEYCHSIKKAEPYTTGINIVRNSDFENEMVGWSLRNCDWKRETEEDTGKKYVTPVGDVKGNWKWMWSDPMEIDADGTKTFIISFDVKVENEISEPLTLMAIRCFKHAKERLGSESLGVWKVVAPVNKVLIGKWMRYSYKFTPNGKFIRIAPHVLNDGNEVRFARIQLECGEQLTDYKPMVGE